MRSDEGLKVIQFLVHLIILKKGEMGAAFDQLSVLKHDDFAGKLYRGEPVRDNNGSTVPHQVFERLLHQSF